MPITHVGAFDESAKQDVILNTGAQFNTTALLNATLTANLITPGPAQGANDVFLQTTANGANSLTTRTAAQMYADIQAAFGTQNINGLSYTLRIVNTGNNTVTLVAGTGVTLSGTMTIATNTTRDFVVTVTNSGAITIQSVGTGTIS